MENKLINFNILEAKNVICVWNTNNPEWHPKNGILRDDAERDFMTPRYIIVGLFEDGSTRASGVHGLNEFNDGDPTDEDSELFGYNHFIYHVDLYYAKAFVRHATFAYYECDETKAKAGIYQDLLKAGVKISDEAKDYLTT